MLKTRKLTDYIDKVEKAYIGARKDYSKAVEELARLEENHKAKMSSGELNAKGVQRENERYTSKRKELLQAIADARDTFSTSAAEIRGSVDTVFRDLFCVNPKTMDVAACELIRSGALTEGELVEMANGYREQGNISMFRFVGSQIDGDKAQTPAARKIAFDSHKPLARTDLELLDAFTDICLKGLRNDISLANGIDRRHEEFYEACYTDAEDISIDVETPWE